MIIRTTLWLFNSNMLGCRGDALLALSLESETRLSMVFRSQARLSSADAYLNSLVSLLPVFCFLISFFHPINIFYILTFTDVRERQ